MVKNDQVMGFIFGLVVFDHVCLRPKSRLTTPRCHSDRVLGIFWLGALRLAVPAVRDLTPGIPPMESVYGAGSWSLPGCDDLI